MNLADAEARKGRRASVAASIALVVAIIATCGSALAATLVYRVAASAQHTVSEQLVLDRTLATVKSGRYLGVVTRNLLGFDRTTGIQANLFVRYVNFGTVPSVAFIDSIHADGATLLLELLPWNTNISAIAHGKATPYLTRLGDVLRQAKVKVLLSFAPEMDATNYPWGYHHTTPRLYVAAFRHVHDAIARTRANVRFVWQVSHEYKQTEKPLSLLWPGSRYVNIVGVDGYIYFDTTTWASMFGQVLVDVRHLTHDPVLIAETAIGPRVSLGAGLVGAGQAQNMNMLWAGIERNHLVGLVWFDHHQHRYPYHQDWSLRAGSMGLKLFHRDALHFVRG